jgi:hypothetical protein
MLFKLFFQNIPELPPGGKLGLPYKIKKKIQIELKKEVFKGLKRRVLN